MSLFLSNSTDWLQKSKRVPQILALLIAIWLIVDLLSAGNLLYRAIKGDVSIALSANANSTPAQTIADLHVFGKYNTLLNNLPETQLQLTLQGTEIDPHNPQASRAIISSAGQPAKAYAIKQLLPGGAIVHEIQRNRIILNHNGILEQLVMPIPSLSKSSPSGVHFSAEAN